MEEVEIISNTNKRMDASLASLKHSLNGLRTGRASVSLLDPIKVEVYGDLMPISQLGTVSVPEPRMLTVQAWDKGVVNSIVKAIAASGLGLNPSADGNLIRIPLPDLSEERRKDLVKKAGEYTEGAKVAIRNIRRDGIDAIKKMEKDKLISEDRQHELCDEVQKLTDDFVKKAEAILKQKSEEIMQV
jgi:ribosome recycling factor